MKVTLISNIFAVFFLSAVIHLVFQSAHFEKPWSLSHSLCICARVWIFFFSRMFEWNFFALRGYWKFVRTFSYRNLECAYDPDIIIRISLTCSFSCQILHCWSERDRQRGREIKRHEEIRIFSSFLSAFHSMHIYTHTYIYFEFFFSSKCLKKCWQT